MRCALGPKKLRKYSKLFGYEFTRGLTRGNTSHRVDLFTADGRTATYWPEDPYFQIEPEKEYGPQRRV